MDHEAVPAQADHKVRGGYVVAQNSPAGVSIGPAAGQGSYTLGGTDAASFSINADTGQLLTSAPLDYETKNQYSVTVSDGAHTTAVAILVTNVKDKLYLNGGTIKDFANNDATQSYSKLDSSSSHKVDGVRLTLLSTITSEDGNDLTITFTEAMQVSPVLDRFITQNNLLGTHLFVLSVLNVEVGGAWPMQTNAKEAPGILMDRPGNPMTLFGATAVTNASTVPADPGASGITMSVR